MNELTVVLIVLIGAAISIGIIIGLFLYLRLRKKMTAKNKQKLLAPNCVELVTVQNFERLQFVTRLHSLRPDAGILQRLLEQTRHQYRAATVNRDLRSADTLRPVVRDLARVLSLLSRADDKITSVPVDWYQLLGWAEQTVNHQKRLIVSKSVSSRSLSTIGGVLTAPRPTSSYNNFSTAIPQLTSMQYPPPIFEQDETDGAHSLPPGGKRPNHKFPPAHHGRPRTRHHRSRQKSAVTAVKSKEKNRHSKRPVPRHNSSMPCGLNTAHQKRVPPLYVHHTNGRRPYMTEQPRHLSESVQSLTARSDIFPVDMRSISTTAPPIRASANQQQRPTYFDWSSHVTRHHRFNQSDRERERTSDLTDTTDIQSVGSQLGGPERPPAPVYHKEKRIGHGVSKAQGSEQSDYIDRDLDSFSGRYHSEEYRTML